MIRLITAMFLYLLLAIAAFAQQPAPVKLAWTHSTDNVAVTGYNVYRDGKKIGTTPTTSYTDNTVAPTTQYSYTISAFDAAGNESDTSLPYVIKTGTIIIVPATADHAFSLPSGSVLHFISRAGSDANDGLTPATAWKSANHTMKCGEVILVEPGTWTDTGDTTRFFSNWGSVTNCPSTTGGIDGTGGVWFAVLLCAGSDLMGCQMVGGAMGGAPNVQMEIQAGRNNWAIEGFYFNSGGGAGPAGARTISGRVSTNGDSLHHIAAINNVMTNSMQGFAGNDGGGQGGIRDRYWDYIAAVGNITQDAVHNGDFQSSICVGSIDFTNLGNWDTNPGTHGYMHNNYGINNQSPACASQYDGHAFYVDSPEAHLFNQQIVISNNIGYLSTRSCIALTASSQNPVPANDNGTYKVYNNTCYHNNGDTVNTNWLAINPNTGANNSNWTMLITNNISYEDTNLASGGMSYAGGSWYALPFPPGVFGSTGNENIFKSIATRCDFGNCDAGFNVEFNNQALPTNVNFFVNPSFANTTDLLANRTGAPDCTGWENTTQCMGWNAAMGSLMVPSVISDLTANCAQCAGKGFQRPSTICAANADYPIWLKAIVYLKASGFTSGATITEKAGLVTKPCGM